MTDEEKITEEQLKEKMQEYGNIRHMLEGLKSEQQTILDRILEKYPEARNEIAELEEELGNKIKEIEATEKKKKNELESMIDEFSKTLVIKDKSEIKTGLVRVGLTRKIEYDPKALDGYAIENPQILGFRKEKIQSRITLNNL